MSKVLRKLTYGMYAVLAMDEGRPTGCIVNTVFQISSKPPIIAISLNKENYTYDIIKKSGRFSVSVLSEDTRREVIAELGYRSGRDHNKLVEIDYDMLDQLPILREDSCAAFSCQVQSMCDAGTHMLILAEVQSQKNGKELPPMTYDYYHRVFKAVAPPAAPTYEAEEAQSAQLSYVCEVCGYVYDGDITQEAKDYRCPMCGVKKEFFKKA